MVHAVVLAAGRGSRLGSVTADKPKLFVPVEGRTVYERQLDVLESFCDRVTVVLGHGFEDAEEETVDAHLHDDEYDLEVDGLVLPNWDEVENAETLRVAIEELRERDLDDDLLVVCGDVLFTRTALGRVLETFETECRPSGRNALGCIEGVQDEMTAIRADGEGVVTDYGAISGHQEVGLFVVHGDNVADAQRLLAQRRTEWFPFVFVLQPTRRVFVPASDTHEINTPEHLEAARERVPLGAGEVAGEDGERQWRVADTDD